MKKPNDHGDWCQVRQEHENVTCLQNKQIGKRENEHSKQVVLRLVNRWETRSLIFRKLHSLF